MLDLLVKPDMWHNFLHSFPLIMYIFPYYHALSLKEYKHITLVVIP